jgi:hypothetical protein
MRDFEIVSLFISIIMFGSRRAFAFSPAFRLARRAPFSHQPNNMIATTRDADFIEEIMGGERYEMVPLPDSMLPTTLFVGNLNEFVTDDILSAFFSSVSRLISVPACVARKPNASSMEYGFVTFPTVQEKEAAILQFHGMEFHGRTLKVEGVRDFDNRNRVRVPGKMVAYACGELKKTRDGRINNLRRISRDDVERLSRGQPSKNKGYGSRNVPHRLNEEERQEMERAAKKGFVTLAGTGYRRGRKGSPLANIHRQWCDAREKPQIVLCKASGGRPLDNVIVDLSPLRINGLFDDPADVEDFLVKWKAEILVAADKSGMELNPDYVQDNTLEFSNNINDDHVDAEEETRTEYTAVVDTDAWATKPIWRLPVVSMGVFEGERSKAKEMARELAKLWDIPETHTDGSGGAKNRRNAGAKNGGKTKMKGIRQHRRKGSG